MLTLSPQNSGYILLHAHWLSCKAMLHNMTHNNLCYLFTVHARAGFILTLEITLHVIASVLTPRFFRHMHKQLQGARR